MGKLWIHCTAFPDLEQRKPIFSDVGIQQFAFPVFLYPAQIDSRATYDKWKRIIDYHLKAMLMTSYMHHVMVTLHCLGNYVNKVPVKRMADILQTTKNTS